ncbi:MAG TPA: hypothetical protein VLA61_18870 [Ideonella sp.]|nr:hypothetical protein [Ideonella sp.]
MGDGVGGMSVRGLGWSMEMVLWPVLAVGTGLLAPAVHLDAGPK